MSDHISISRQAVTDLIEENDPFWCEGMTRTDDGVNRLPSIDTEPHWIPCSERLLEKSDQYYVSSGDKVWICEFLIIPNFTGGWCNDASNPVIQAWMPLPKPYEGDKK